MRREGRPRAVRRAAGFLCTVSVLCARTVQCAVRRRCDERCGSHISRRVLSRWFVRGGVYNSALFLFFFFFFVVICFCLILVTCRVPTKNCLLRPDIGTKHQLRVFGFLVPARERPPRRVQDTIRGQRSLSAGSRPPASHVSVRCTV